MNKKLLIFFYLLLGLIASFFASQALAQSTKVAVSPDMVVKTLYRNYAWEVIFLNSASDELTDQSSGELLKYFTPELVKLIIKDRACREKTGDACALDFDPIFSSQDRGSVRDLEIGAMDATGIVKVKFRTSTIRPIVELRLKMKSTSLGWRIDDINYEQGRPSLHQLLSSR